MAQQPQELAVLKDVQPRPLGAEHGDWAVPDAGAQLGAGARIPRGSCGWMSAADQQLPAPPPRRQRSRQREPYEIWLCRCGNLAVLISFFALTGFFQY
jgi:hypothetical protein